MLTIYALNPKIIQKNLSLRERFTSNIFGRKLWQAINGPLHTHGGVAPKQAAFKLGVPIVGGFVQKLCAVAGDHKAMGKTWGYPQLAVIAGG